MNIVDIIVVLGIGLTLAGWCVILLTQIKQMNRMEDSARSVENYISNVDLRVVQLRHDVHRKSLDKVNIQRGTEIMYDNMIFKVDDLTYHEESEERPSVYIKCTSRQ